MIIEGLLIAVIAGGTLLRKEDISNLFTKKQPLQPTLKKPQTVVKDTSFPVTFSPTTSVDHTPMGGTSVAVGKQLNDWLKGVPPYRLNRLYLGKEKEFEKNPYKAILRR